MHAIHAQIEDPWIEAKVEARVGGGVIRTFRVNVIGSAKVRGKQVSVTYRALGAIAEVQSESGAVAQSP